MGETATSLDPASRLAAEERDRLDREVEAVRHGRDAWAGLPVEGKIAYARSLLDGFRRVARGQVEAAVAAKGATLDSPVAGEEWLSGPYINLRITRLLIETLEQIRSRGRVEFRAAAVRTRPHGRLAVRVFPSSSYDRLLYAGFSAEVWLRGGVDRENLHEQTARVYRQPTEGRLALVLGAGNVSSIGPMDVLHKLFGEGQVAILKLNPVNDYLRPFIEDAFRELIDAGFVRVVSGGAAVGDYLCRHRQVEEIHITGSARTHDLIVWGPGEEGRRRRQRNEPRISKRITSELGNVSPMIVLPGRWSDADLQFQAENLATQMTHNGGFNCNATRVIVTHAAWPQRRQLLDRLGAVLAQVRRSAYYPGAAERYARFLAAYPEAKVHGEASGDVLPPALAEGLDPEDEGPAYGEEAFCAFSAETPLPAGGAGEFLERAVDFCNHRLYGTLNAGLVVDPQTRRELGERLPEAVERLRYGSVAINHWPALAYGLGTTPWGAYPGHTLDDVQSGIGSVHNARLLEAPEKAVVDGPFRVFPKPVWFVTHRRAHRVGPHLARLEADPSPLRLPPIFWHALRG